MMSKKNIALMTLALTACVSTAFAQTNWLKDDFNGPILTWTKGGTGQIQQTNQQLVVSGSFGPMQTNDPVATSVGAYHTIGLPSGPLPDQQTLELRADLVGANQNDAWAGIHFLWSPEYKGYILWKDQDEVVLHKFWSSAGSLVAAAFFYENRPVKNQNVTLVLALTRLGSDVRITTRVLDKDNANAVLFERTVTDTPQADPVLPNRAVRGWIGVADLAGTPWLVVTAPTYVTLGLQWANPASATQRAAAVTFDNAEVWQYESPQLAFTGSS